MPRRALATLLLLLSQGCNASDLLQKVATPEDESLARNYISLLGLKRFEEIEKAADPSIRNPSLHDSLERMAALIPPEAPASTTLVGAHRMNLGDTSTVNLTFEYGFSGAWLVTNVALRRQGDDVTIVGFGVYPLRTSLTELNKFTLSGRTPTHYFFSA